MATPSQVYIHGDSKAAINRRLKAGDKLEALYYGLPYNDVFDVEALRDGCVVKVFSKYVGGNPYAKAYGTIKRDKNGKVTIA